MAGTDAAQETRQDWRKAQFESMGFTTEQAEQLADMRGHDGWPLSYDWVREELIGKGCSWDLAMQILL